MTRLVLCEKPSVAQAVSVGLGVPMAGGLPYRSDDWIIAAARGHLLEGCKPEDYDPALSDWRLEDLPILPEEFKWKPREEGGALELLGRLLELIDDPEVQELVNACDAGREGELIFKLILRQSGSRKPVRRAWFSSLTPGAVRRAFEELRPDQDLKGLEAAAVLRDTGDWLIGINGTRAATLVARRAVGEDASIGVVSLGRVQTPTLGILVDREREIDKYRPIPFYWVHVTLEGGIPAAVVEGPDTDEDQDVANLRSRGPIPLPKRRYAALDDARAVAADLVGAPLRLRGGGREEVERPAPLPFDLATLQVEASRAFGWTADRTLRRAQSLYEKQYISYPRTDSRFLTWDLKSQIQEAFRALRGAFPALAPHLENLHAQAEEGTLSGRPFNSALVRDHHAIIPTGKQGAAEALNADEAKLHELVARRLVAAFLPPFREEIVRAELSPVDGELAGALLLEARGRRSLDPGWREVEGGPLPGEDPNLAALLAIAEGPPGAEAGTISASESVERLPRRPRAHTDGTLIRAMERAAEAVPLGGGNEDDPEGDEVGADVRHVGIGTPATRAGIIETLLRRRYAARDTGTIYATIRGRRLIEALEDLDVASPQLTARWEARLAHVEEGEEDPAAFRRDVKALARSTVDAIRRRSLTPLLEGPPVVGDCPRCGGLVLARDKVFGCDSWKGVEDPGCGWAVFRNTRKGRIGVEEARVRVEEDRPHATNAGVAVAPLAPQGAHPADMEPYVAASEEGPPLPGPSGAGADADQLEAAWDEAILQVVRQEGPVLARRITRVLGPLGRHGGGNAGWVKQQVNRRTHALVHAGVLEEVDDARAPEGQQDRVFVLPGSPEVSLRTRGPRGLREIPLREIAACAKAMGSDGGGRGGEPIRDQVLRAFQVPRDHRDQDDLNWFGRGLELGTDDT